MSNVYELAAIVISSSDGAASILTDGSPINILSTAGQAVSAVASLSPAGTLATAPGAFTLTALKITTDVQNGATISPGDIISLTGNVVGIIAVVGSATAAGPVVLTAGALSLGLSAVSAVMNSVNSGRWPSIIDAARRALIPGYASEQMLISSYVSNLYRTAISPPRQDPLAIDLDGDGIETSGLPTSGSPILFDLDNDGVKTGTGWLKGDDAWLVLDRNGNGTIDSGAELFGVAEGDGFAALRELDRGDGSLRAGAYDGVFDSRDEAFTQVRLWQDRNQDGISQADELITLAQANISSISLASSTSTKNFGNGNSLNAVSSATRTDGSQTVVGNLVLASNPFYRQFVNKIVATDTAKALPDMGGSGWLRDLCEAMSLGTPSAATLATRIASFAATSARDGQLALVDSILEDWARTSGRLNAAQQIERVRTELLSTTSAGLMMRTVAADQPLSLADSPPEAGQLVEYLFQDASLINPNPNGPALYGRVNEAGMAWLARRNILEAFNGQRFFDTTQLVPQGGGGSGGGGGGGAASSSLAVVAWRITVTAQQVSLMNQAYDALRDSVYQALVLQTRLKPYLDAIELQIDASGVRFSTTAMNALLDARRSANEQSGFDDLVELVRFAGPTLQTVKFDGVAKLRDWVESMPADSPLRARFEGLHLSVGTPRSSESSDVFIGSAANDSVQGQGGNDTLAGGGGNDWLYGGEGNDVLRGEAGDDYLVGDAGDDVLDGGSGRDYLAGGTGNNTYLFGRGDGYDTIYSSSDRNTSKFNVLQFKPGVAATDIRVTRSGDALELKIIGSGDSITVNGFFEGDTTGGLNSPVQQIRFADGTSWEPAAMMTKLLGGTDGNDWIPGSFGDDVITGLAGDDSLYGRAGNDTLRGDGGKDYLNGEDGSDRLEGGAGDDVLYGGTGDDTLDGGAGRDWLSGDAGNNTYLFGRGDGADTIQPTSDRSATKFNVLQFKDGVAAADVSVARSGNDLVLKIAGTSDSMIVNAFFEGDTTGGPTSPVQQVRFTDGTTWEPAALMTRVLAGTDGNDWIAGSFADDVITGQGGNDWIYGRAGNDIARGGDGSDWIYGEDGNDRLEGGAGDDYLYGGMGDDVLDGGAGRDFMSADVGNNTYLFGRGDGADTIYQTSDRSATKFNVLQFKDGVAAADVCIARSGNDLLLKIVGTSDTVTVNAFFTGDTVGDVSSPVQQVRFADGTSWEPAALMTRVLAGTDGNDNIIASFRDDLVTGQGGNDWLYGQAGNDTVLGGDGNDWIYGGDGNDRLEGGAGDDYLYGGTGDDVLDGGAGRDYMSGDAGDNTYLFGRGDGADTIYQTSDRSATKFNVLQFKDGVAAADVCIARSGNDLVLKISGTSDSITVNAFFTGDTVGDVSSPVQQVRFADGTTWEPAALMTRVLAGTDGNDNIIASFRDDLVTGQGGNDWLYGQAGNDTVLGGDGNDWIYGGDGNDRLEGGAGDDYLYGGTGDDVLDGGAGRDYMSGDAGDNTYLFGRGDGADTIYQTSDRSATKFNVLQFKDGVAAADVCIARSGNDLVLKISGTSDSITVNAFFTGDTVGDVSSPVQQVRFADGTTWEPASLMARLLIGTSGTDYITASRFDDVVDGLSGDDWLYGQAGNDTLLGGDGNDFLYGGEGNDILKGGTGNDNLNGGTGDDVLEGGTGSDSLYGGSGNDTYLYRRGDGGDYFVDADATTGNTDVLVFGEQITSDQLWFRRVGSDLEVSIIGTMDRVRVGNWYAGASNHLEQFKTADGKVLLDSQVDALVSAMAGFAPPPAGQTTLPAGYQSTLSPVIAASWG